MPTLVTLTGNVADLVGGDIDPTTVDITVSTNLTEGDFLVDETNNVMLLGDARTSVSATGAFSIANLAATSSTDLNVAAGLLRYRLNVSYRLRTGRERKTIASPWFQITANSTVAALAFEPTTISPTFEANVLAAVTAAQAAETAAELARDQAQAFGGTNNTQVAAMVTGAGATQTALDSRVDGRIATNAERKTRLVVGATNSDYSTLTAALAAATAGTEIALRPGTYTISGANTVPAGVRISGVTPGLGTGAAVIQGSYNTTVSALTMQAGSSIEGVYIKNTHATGGTAVVPVAVDIRAAGVVVRDCTFSGPWAQAILAYQSTDVRITDCTFEAIGLTTGSTPGDGINLYGVNGAVVSGCQFRDLKQNALYCNASSKNVTISNNTVRGGPEGMQVRVGCSNVTITGNVFDIKGSSTVYSVGVIIQTQCTDCVVSNNTFRTTTGTATPVAAILVDDRSHRTVISGNTISGSGFAKGIAIATTSSAGNESKGCIITGNTIDACAGFAVHVASAEDGAIVQGNRVFNGSNRGIVVAATRCAVVGNVVTSNTGPDGIGIDGAFCTVTGNVVTNVASGSGIKLTSTDGVATGNFCTGNAVHGIHETGNLNVITSNNVPGNTHASQDINSAGASSKVAYNIGRYTQKGAA